MDWAELANWEEYTKLFIGLLALTAPESAVPVFLGLTKHLSAAQAARVAYLTPLVFVVILWLHVFFGAQLLGFFGITIPAFRVAGGLLLLLIGIDMMRGALETDEQTPAGPVNPLQVAFVPLAVPLTAGPGAISAVIVYSHLHESVSHLLLVGAVVLAVGAVLWIALRFAGLLNAWVGDTGMLVFKRIMGLIVTAVGVEFVLDGVAAHFPELFHFQGHV